MKYAERIMDDPHTIVFANPPTYPGAYEKFFETGGRVITGRASPGLFVCIIRHNVI